MALNTVLTGDHARRRPRTCTAEFAIEASSGDNLPTYVADLAIDPLTGQADFSNSVPIQTQVEDSPQLRENMKQLLDMIMLYFEEEDNLVESGTLPVAEALFHDVQTNNSSTQSNTRLLPPQFKSRRA